MDRGSTSECRGGIISQSSIEGSGRAEMEFDVFWEIYHNPIKTGHISKVT